MGLNDDTYNLSKWPPEQFTPELVEAVEKIKDALCTYPILRLPDNRKPYVLLTDASRVAAGCALCKATVS